MPAGGAEALPSRSATGAARILLTLILLAVLALITAVPLVDRLVLTPERIRTTLVPILAARLGRSIEIEDAHLSWRGLALTGVSIAEDDSFGDAGNAAVVRADRIVLLINPFALRRREITIEQLFLQDPAVTIARSADKTWNLATFGEDRSDDRSAERDGSDASGGADGGGGGWKVRVHRVRIQNGSITYFDAFEHAPDKPLWAQLDELDARMWAGATRGTVELRLDGRLRGSHVPDPAPDQVLLETPLSIGGPVDLRERSATLDVGAEVVDVDAIIALLKKDPALPKKKHVGKRRPSMVHFDTTVGRVLYEGYQFERVGGRIALADVAVISGELDADLAGGAFNLQATFDLAGDGVTVGGRATATGAAAGTVLQRLRTPYLPTLQGKADVELELHGHADRFGDAFKAALPARRAPSGGTLEVRASFDLERFDGDSAHIDIVELLVQDADARSAAGTERLPVDFAGLDVVAKIHAKEATVQAIPFTDLVIHESLVAGKNVSVATADAVHGRDARLELTVDFADRRLPYEGRVVLNGVNVATALEKYTDLRCGNTAGRMDIDIELAGGLYGVRGDLLETLLAMRAQPGFDAVANAKVKLDLERVDLETLLGRSEEAIEPLADAAAEEPLHDIDPRQLDSTSATDATADDTPLGPIDTGALHIELELELGETAALGYVFHDVEGTADLTDSVVSIHELTGQVAGGSFDLTTTIGLDYPGLIYDGRLDIISADIPALLEPFSLDSLGDPVGVMTLHAQLDGHGTRFPRSLEGLSAEVEIDVPQGRLRESPLFRQIEKATGIPGFHDFQVKNSGGHVVISGGRVSTERLLIGGEEARILGGGRLEFDGALSFDLELGFGPESQRRLLAPGILLPYSVDKDGWTNIPLRLEGRIGEPEVHVPVDAYAGTAMRAGPDAAGRLISGGAGTVTKGGTKVIQGGANAVGAVFGGIGSVLTGSQAEQPVRQPAAERGDEDPVE